jgi:PAS domain S-box-containing protein
MISILLIDHAIEPERRVRELLAAPSPNNFRVDRVISYREILRGFRSKAYDVCLIDSGFGNGLKLFAQSRGLGFTAPVVLVTANNAPEVLEALRYGIADCLIRDELDASRIERSICSVVEQARGAAFQVERERRYLALLDNADAIIYTHDLDGNITSINRAGERLIGFSQQELLGLHISQLVDPAYRNRVRNMIEHTLDAQARTVEEVKLLTKEGHNLAVTVGVHPIYRQGKAIEIQGIVTTLPGLDIASSQDAPDIFAGGPERYGWPNRIRQFNYNSELARKPSLATEMIDNWSGPLRNANSILGIRNLHD